jgi:hypothetical protein
MSTSDLLDVFGGQDNLILMCDARRFKRDGDRSVSFWVGPYIVRVSKGTYTDYKGLYHPYFMGIRHRKTKMISCTGHFLRPEHVQFQFVQNTGFVLEF